MRKPFLYARTWRRRIEIGPREAGWLVLNRDVTIPQQTIPATACTYFGFSAGAICT